MSFFTSLFFSAIAIASPFVQPIESTWRNNIQCAQEVAVQKNLPLLVAFLGPDWCRGSDQLEEQILCQPAFLANIKDRAVLVRVNIAENFAQEGFEGDQWEIQSCPTLLLLTAAGEEIARFGASDVDPKQFAEQITGRIEDYNQLHYFTQNRGAKHLSSEVLKELYSKALALTNSKLSSQILEEGLKRDRSPYFLLEQYGQMAKGTKVGERKLRKIRGQIASRDPENRLGCHREMALIDFAALSQLGKRKNNAYVVKPLVEYLAQFGKEDREHAWMLEMKISQYLFSHNDSREALKHAQASLQLAPTNAQDEVIQSINYLKTHQ